MSLQVLLEKLTGICLVEKLKYTQLYEADFNFFQQFIFGQEAMKLLTEQKLLPEDHFSKKGSTGEDAKFDKTLMNDLSRQSRTPMSIVSVDAAKCYNRVNHVLMPLVWLALIGVIGHMKVLLHCLQTMIFFRGQDMKIQVPSQGAKNSASWDWGKATEEPHPCEYLCLIPVIVNMLRKLKHGAHIIDPMAGILIHLVDAMFVDGSDFYC